ncbi:MAG: hypothetical protein WCS74_00830 [Dehalococcoidales bacterium]|jgi:predicted PurR-regulated permease PerM|nr:hypothetical protein [Dehalococcoidales bacterium]MDD3264686.1 hypothetical protein [Dehalococcoidales bacterium]MDD4322521.1 hypothetical protein [Dehalococcoidales bacterium]MDD4794100.1 hypothetical protein [Dehalococcoidales bacterium]MDD5121978.1 hypothetical protein [Dehalococcoidales bacterium]
MEIELIRDIVIIASGVIFIIVLLIIAFVALSISSKVKEVTSSAKGILNKAETAAEDLKLITSYTREEIARPLAHVAGIVQGVGQGLSSFTEILKKWK